MIDRSRCADLADHDGPTRAPIWRKQGPVKLTVQTKDAVPGPPFILKIEAEGPRDAPTLVRLTVEENRGDPGVDERVYQAVATLLKTDALTGQAGVTVRALAEALKCSDKTIRPGLVSRLGLEPRAP